MRVVFVSLCAVVIIGLVIPAMSHMFSTGYADSWAVEVEGGEKVAKALAEKHGFEFMGQVRRSLCSCGCGCVGEAGERRDMNRRCQVDCNGKRK